MIKSSRKLMLDVISKMSRKDSINLVQNLLVLFSADPSTVCNLTRLISHHLNYDNNLIFSIEMELFIWQIFSWNKIYNTSKLLRLRAQQLEPQNEDSRWAAVHLKRIPPKSEILPNLKHGICKETVGMEDIVLL